LVAKSDFVDVPNPRVVAPYPSSIDWRTKGAVSPVPDEGQCGSIICGFAVAANVEGVRAAQGFELIPLSAMPPMLCQYPGTCGCYFPQSYTYYINKQAGKIDTNASWPLDLSECEATGKCDTANREYGATIAGLIRLPHNETAMTEYVGNTGPIAVAVNAQPWMTYKSGIFTKCGSGGQVDHVAVIVGYDDNSSPPYWIIKNWWSTEWGEEGYIRLEKGTNQCDITSQPLTASVVN